MTKFAHVWFARSRLLLTLAALAFFVLSGSFEAHAQVTIAQLSYPAGGATDVDGTQPFQWTAVANAQAYQLYVGTSPGSSDIYNSGQTQETSRTVVGLPSSHALFARIWTRVDGTWYYSDRSFSTAPVVLAPAVFTYPADGSSGVDGTVFQWTAVASAQAYYLWVGSSPGAKDLYASGETQATSQSVPSLPASQLLYARIWTKVSGTWYYSTISFTTASDNLARLTYPANGASGVDGSLPFQWSAGTNAQAYQLYVGTSAGASDVHNSGQLQGTSRLVPTLPANRTLYARIWTKPAVGAWNYKDSTFTTAASTVASNASFVYPLAGAIGVDGATAFQWTPVAGAQSYVLQVGTAPGTSNVYNSGETQDTNRVVAGLLPNRTLYAQIWTKLDGPWYSKSISFTSASAVLSQATFTYPLNGNATVAGSVPFEWTGAANAQSYQLFVGTSAGAKDLYDSGQIQNTSVLVPDLPSNRTLYARIWTGLGSAWYYKDVSFTTTAVPSGAFADRLTLALQATADVRAMADTSNNPYPGTELEQVTHNNGRTRSNCDDYAITLLNVVRRANLGSGRTMWISFDGFDSHTAAEFYNEAQNTWMVLDPSFALSPKRSTDGSWATKEDVSNATLSQNWNAISYQFLSGSSLTLLQNYYIDYPLLYGTIYKPGTSIIISAGNSPLPYLEQVSLPVNEVPTYYVMSNPEGGTAPVLVNGQTVQVSFTGIASFSSMVSATTISLPAGSASSIQAYRVRRYVFGLPKATLTYPVEGTNGVDGTVPFAWTPIANAQAYQLQVGTSPGASDLHSSGPIQQVTRPVLGLPANQTLYARIWTRTNNTWQYNTVSFSTASTVLSQAQFTYPSNGATGIDATAVPFAWTPVSSAEAYQLQVGTTTGAKDLYDSGVIQGTSRSVGGLPANQTVYARIWTKIGGSWYYKDISFMTAPSV